MSPELIGILGVCIIFILLFSGMSVGLALGFVGFIGYSLIIGFDKALTMVSSTVYSNLTDYTFTILPAFVFMGAVVSNSGLGEVIFGSAYKVIGWIRGGLYVATVLACTVFAALCGVSMAEVITIGRIALPEMKKYGYDDALSCGVVACGGGLAVLIPPSVGFVLYGLLTGNSIGLCLFAGILPGILLMCLFLLIILITVLKSPKKAPPGPRTSFNEKVKAMKSCAPIVILICLVLVGIYLGIFTPTEAGAVGTFCTVIIVIFSGYFSFRKLLDAIKETAEISGMIFVMMAGAFTFMKFMAVTNLPALLADYIAGLNMPVFIIFAIIVAIYVLIGMFFEIITGLILTLPFIYPIITKLGLDPIWFGVVVVLLMQMGVITPPIGFDIYALSGISKVPVKTMFRGVAPFTFMILVTILLLYAFPQIALFIPNMMVRR